MVAKGMGLDSRIGEKFLQTGPGYGGSCFPKDTAALAKTARDFNAPASIVETVITANDSVKSRMAKKIAESLAGNVRGKTIAILGLAFKAETDDMRDAPALTILPILAKAGATIQAYDPESMPQAKNKMPNLTYCNSSEEACKNADAVVMMTEWNEFKTLDLAIVKSWMNGDVLIDLRNLFSAEIAWENGLNYVCIGKNTSTPQQQKVA
jgi:UDPglucose 6-dehydrogenase